MSSRIPRRASRNLTPWQRFKRWWHSFRQHCTVIQFDDAPSVRESLRRKAPPHIEVNIKKDGE